MAPAPRRLETVEGREIGQSCRDWAADGLLEYAQKIRSDPGKKNGLYWEVKEGEERSPLGPIAAAAQKQGYSKKGQDPEPFFRPSMGHRVS